MCNNLLKSLGKQFYVLSFRKLFIYSFDVYVSHLFLCLCVHNTIGWLLKKHAIINNIVNNLLIIEFYKNWLENLLAW
jgi:hypothetical protein